MIHPTSTRHTPSRLGASSLKTALRWAGASACVAVLACYGGCGGSGGQKDDQEKSAEAVRTEGEEVFAPGWSMNAAPPPKAGEIREIGSIFDELPEGFAVQPTPQASKKPAAEGPVDRSASNWTIAIEVFRGERNFEEASRALAIVRREGGLPEAFVQRRGPSSIIAFGSYKDPTDARAQGDLDRVKSVKINGEPPYSGSYLCPPYTSGKVAQANQYDLRRAKQTYGQSVLYTLQVGWYGREDQARSTEEDLKEARKAAEEAVERLRREGELAFFYHGPNRSMVTVGVYDGNDFDSVKKPGFESARLREAKRRHPLNLYNGAGYRYKASGMRESKLLPSGLVAIPSK